MRKGGWSGTRDVETTDASDGGFPFGRIGVFDRTYTKLQGGWREHRRSILVFEWHEDEEQCTMVLGGWSEDQNWHL